ncbi:hypothetical protein B0H11DRAFT_2321798 [Mycena galericulata]|nr:hypothetical protein B0H11DRAFT_2321798 [Mycena galericulata]
MCAVFVASLLPALSAAHAAGEPACALCVLATGLGPAVDLQDLDLGREYNGKAAMDASMTYTELTVKALASLAHHHRIHAQGWDPYETSPRFNVGIYSCINVHINIHPRIYVRTPNTSTNRNASTNADTKPDPATAATLHAHLQMRTPKRDGASPSQQGAANPNPSLPPPFLLLL